MHNLKPRSGWQFVGTYVCNGCRYCTIWSELTKWNYRGIPGWIPSTYIVDLQHCAMPRTF